MHVDTRWKFREMYLFRNWMAQKSNMKLITHINPEGVKSNINPFDHGSSVHTDIMKTQGSNKPWISINLMLLLGCSSR